MLASQSPSRRGVAPNAPGASVRAARLPRTPAGWRHACNFRVPRRGRHQEIGDSAAGDYARRDGRLEPDDLFFAEQNARVVANAERTAVQERGELPETYPSAL